MASHGHARAQSAMGSSTNHYYNNNDHNNNNTPDRELLSSLNKLSLNSSPHNGRPSTSRNTSERYSSASPGLQGSKRNPGLRINPNGGTHSQEGTPTLVRKSSMTSMHSMSGITPGRALSRRSSSNAFPSPTTGGKSPANGPVKRVEEKPVHTPYSLATSHFRKELELLHLNEADQSAETIVILHDACYGHRFSRPRTSKSALNTIVERPERIQASVLGVSLAYIRLGERHCDGRNPIHPTLDPRTLPGIPFRIHKTSRTLPITSTAVTNVHGTKWMEELQIMCESAEMKLALNGNELRRPEMNRGSDSDPPQKFHEGDLYLCAESLSAFEGALGAVCEAVDTVFSSSPHKRAFVAVRPPGHHCSASYPSGFCWVNNVHVGIMHAILNHGLTHAAIIDFDLHHGDGSQAIAWQHNKRGLAKNAAAWKKTSIGYFSVHDINSYPCEYGDDEKVKNASLCIENAHGQNIWNVHLNEWKSDVEFWRLYQSKYSILLEKARNYLKQQTERFRASGQAPKAVIFLSAGFDASEWEGAGMQRHKVNVPTEFYARLTRDVVKIASEEGLGVEGRVISVLEGGYSDRALYSGVLSHLGGLAGTEPIVSRDDTGGLGNEMSGRIGSVSRRSTLNESDFKSWKVPGFPYDPHWWSASELDQLDAGLAAIPAERPRIRCITPGNYSSPTQSSNAKMTETARVRQSLSGVTAGQRIITRPPTPPPPDVPWVTAAHALSRLLIPNDRPTTSCKHEELNAEANKAKRERQSDAASEAGTSAPAPTRMSLRERKPVKSMYPIEDEDVKSRRKTVGGTSVLAAEKASARGIPTHGDGLSRPSSRRLSTASAFTAAARNTMDYMDGYPRPTTSQSARPTTSQSSRPTTSQSIRPESSLSMRGQPASTLNVKKTRQTGASKKESSTRATRAPRKTKTTKSDPTPPESTCSSNTPLPDETDEKPLTPPGQDDAAVRSRLPTPTSPNSSRELDKLANGMRRIKINVVTKEMKEARQREAEKKAMEEREAQEEMRAVASAKIEKAPSSDGKSAAPSTEGFPSPSASSVQSSVNPLTNSRELSATGSPVGYPKEATSVVMNGSLSPPPEPSNILTPTGHNPLYPSLMARSPAQASPDSVQNNSPPTQRQPRPESIALPSPTNPSEPANNSPPIPPKPNHLQSPNFQPPQAPQSPATWAGHNFTATSEIPFARTPGKDVASPVARENFPMKRRTSVKEKARAIDQGVWDICDTPGPHA
ncbi:hypothetical protein F5X96DRAFT_621560 [Biscogniauxia mediterranea]|nr:hypothetical protein F5X96DRAFT_621560 [Biscogniauxia mediterranea]